MRKSQWLALCALVGTTGLVLALAEPAKPDKSGEPRTLQGRIAKATKFTDAQTQKFLRALGPAIRDMLQTGAQVEIPGLGTFRVVRIPEHRDLVGGRPATIPGSNYVEFLPTGDLINTANTPETVPAETVPPFEYIINPYQTPGQKTGTTRNPGTRTRGGG
jgi:nucleoid DNA-binding protein